MCLLFTSRSSVFIRLLPRRLMSSWRPVVVCLQVRPSEAPTASCVPSRLPNPAKCRWLDSPARPASSRWPPRPPPATTRTRPPPSSRLRLWTPRVGRRRRLCGGAEVTLIFKEFSLKFLKVLIPKTKQNMKLHFKKILFIPSFIRYSIKGEIKISNLLYNTRKYKIITSSVILYIMFT